MDRKLKNYILEKYKDKVEESKQRLCAFCSEGVPNVKGEFWYCLFNLLPVTSDGEDCPYFIEKPLKRSLSFIELWS